MIPAPLRNRKVLDKVGTMLAVRVAATAVTKQLDITNSTTIRNLRVVYLLIQFVSVVIFVYILVKVNATNDRTVIKTKPSRVVARVKGIVMRVVTGKTVVDPQEHELVTTTVGEYDAAAAKNAIKGVVRGVVLMGGVAVLLGWNKMLIAPCISQPVATFRHALFQLHILNEKPVGDLAREATPEQVAAAEKAATAKDTKDAKAANGHGTENKVSELDDNVSKLDDVSTKGDDGKTSLEADLAGAIGEVIEAIAGAGAGAPCCHHC
ncbi:hypothetical protein CcaverHIS002_0102570 [Cutaneotrichosporon cavernicola]|uniref:Uncharacterized protein n=1 Tax=Cutaneotrichosporon cavernicola TaxID=279322 RepID=A0AA48L1U9_9TREE|nr:uncharacterized protein CcaverHIS019_0102510 [Cutaneotrichosporon cavernicola]BEI79728.1 hypothetical protein CcaverHIS002_0102570 [Cutaneotrichosporon cavernicola]BEI87533.1 hypothetical protein CcaverHIS019_0102510 [Cutaneotrichosporon cavernicola]BEI95305.1 hypothetical protein CcaverHIS631_0102540 [Cutaneotrichosporon cavernicola]BEJ03078.1 hypothetical protein CcaverHIS641_0102530 [Cutaneotrichosporon cavernicola]